MTAITSLFGGADNLGKVAVKGAEGIYNGLDKLFYTDEEKAEARIKAGQLYLDFIKAAYDENSTRSVTRRWLAFIVVGPMMICFVAGIIVFFFNVGASEYMSSMFEKLVPWGGGILMFYFGPHIVSSLKK